MSIYPIVEGYGEVEAAPVLLRRLLEEAQCFNIDIGSPIRRTQSQLRSKQGIQVAVQLAMLQPQCNAVIILFDGEDVCPATLAGQVLEWATEVVAGRIACNVVIAYREYETWFLAAVESLRGKYGIRNDAVAPAQPESCRDAKGALEGFMPHNRVYSETGDQPGMSALFDMGLAYKRNRSFRKMVKVVGDVLTNLNLLKGAWPPAQWLQERTP
ncbi:MAG: DUF4276 family protein [Phycisphaerae bacterium]|jgi:hypothetical protein